MALPKPPTAAAIQRSVSNNSPYYYGGGGGDPRSIPVPTYKPQKPVIQTTGQGDVPWHISTPAADFPGYTAPGSAGYSTPTGTGYGQDLTTPNQANPSGPSMPTYDMPEPDWNALINANFYTQGAESQAAPMRAQADLGLQQGLRSALYNYGWDPDTMSTAKLGAAAPYIDQASIDAAQGNRYSALSTIARNQDYGQRASDAALAARGMLAFGAKTEDMRALADTAGSQRANAYDALMGQVNQGVQQRANVESQIAQMLQQAREQAAQFVSQNYQQSSAAYMADYLSKLTDYYNNQPN